MSRAGALAGMTSTSTAFSVARNGAAAPLPPPEQPFHSPRDLSASMTAVCSHPALHLTRILPFLPSVMSRLGSWSSWAGHRQRHPLPYRLPPSLPARSSAVIVSLSRGMAASCDMRRNGLALVGSDGAHCGPIKAGAVVLHRTAMPVRLCQRRQGPRHLPRYSEAPEENRDMGRWRERKENA